MDVAVIGGTGAEGFGLTLRLTKAGHHVVIGSRSADKGAAKAADALEIVGGDARVDGTTNEEAAASADVVLVRFRSRGRPTSTARSRPRCAAGAVVLDATSPLATAVGGRPWQVDPPVARLGGRAGRAILGQGPRLVSGVPHDRGEGAPELPRPARTDVLLCGDDAEAKATIGSLVDDIPGLRWVDAGALSMARIVETMTALLVT